VESIRPRAQELDVALVITNQGASRGMSVKLIIMKGRQGVIKEIENKFYEVVSANVLYKVKVNDKCARRQRIISHNPL
jgi:RNA-binding protein YhbY